MTCHSFNRARSDTAPCNHLNEMDSESTPHAAEPATEGGKTPLPGWRSASDPCQVSNYMQRNITSIILAFF